MIAHHADSDFGAETVVDGTPGMTTVANAYHYADNRPLEREDPLGLFSSSDGNLGLTVGGIETGSGIQATSLGYSPASTPGSEFPFGMFLQWHNDVRDALVARDSGSRVTNCSVKGGGPNGGYGFPDVCDKGRTSIWEVKAFGPASTGDGYGAEEAVTQIARYVRAYGGAWKAGKQEPAELVRSGSRVLLAFSMNKNLAAILAPSINGTTNEKFLTGARMYWPIDWIAGLANKINRKNKDDENRSKTMIEVIKQNKALIPELKKQGIVVTQRTITVYV